MVSPDFPSPDFPSPDFLYEDQGKYDEALPLSQRALAIVERTLGHDHRNVADDRSAEKEGKS
jgi:hypothetical protein